MRLDLTIPPLIIDTSGFMLKIYTDRAFAECIIKTDAVLDEAFARESKRLLQEACPGRKYLLLVSSQGFIRVTKKARRIGADKAFSEHLEAVACYTNNPSLALLGELYNKINKPAVTTKIFSTREAALEWLSELMKQQKEEAGLKSPESSAPVEASNLNQTENG